MTQTNTVGGKEHHAAFGVLNGTPAVHLVSGPSAKTFQAINKEKAEQPKREKKQERRKSQTFRNDLPTTK